METKRNRYRNHHKMKTGLRSVTVIALLLVIGIIYRTYRADLDYGPAAVSASQESGSPQTDGD